MTPVSVNGKGYSVDTRQKENAWFNHSARENPSPAHNPASRPLRRISSRFCMIPLLITQSYKEDYTPAYLSGLKIIIQCYNFT
jgi:hypothetical protein